VHAVRAAGAALVAAAVFVVPAADAPAFADTAGAPGLGDAYFPSFGNGGYDTGHYDLDLRYDPASGRLDGQAVVTATAVQNLARFDLDFARLDVTGLTVDGAPARWRFGSGRELVIAPAALLPRGHRFTVDVRYHGQPGTTEEERNIHSGLFRSPAGAFAAGEPDGAPHWFPVNDHPRDKAYYDFAVTVPDGFTAIANGVAAGTTRGADGWTTWRWHEGAPMASYLATVAIGHFRVTTGTVAGVPLVTAVAESLPAQPIDEALARIPDVVDFLASRFGPYPFDALGAIVPDDSRLTYALETQTRPVYASRFFTRGGTVDDRTQVVAHELAHQWFGDSVSLYDWRDIWLNEGFATYAQWLWNDHLGGETVQHRFDALYGAPVDREAWRPPPGAPGVRGLLAPSVYVRGAMTLHALRRTVGDDTFFTVLRSWAAGRRYGNGTTGDFVALAERISGRRLGPLFQAWLYGTGKPPRP
jgi:aminopeptidase N